jgi:hypothetical protein
MVDDTKTQDLKRPTKISFPARGIYSQLGVIFCVSNKKGMLHKHAEQMPGSNTRKYTDFKCFEM